VGRSYVRMSNVYKDLERKREGMRPLGRHVGR
jgi:hypothetical protein